MAESKMRRWFGREHNPARRRRVQQASSLLLVALTISGLTTSLLGPLGPAAWIPGMAVAVALLVLGVYRILQAAREPHWNEPEGGR